MNPLDFLDDRLSPEVAITLLATVAALAAVAAVWSAALARDLVVLLSDRDTDTEHSSLNRSDDATMQGRHRLARGQFFYDFGREMAARLIPAIVAFHVAGA